MLAEYFHARHDIGWQKRQHFTIFVLYYGWIRHRTFNGIATLGWFVRSHLKGNLRAGTENMTDHPLMRLARLFTERVEA